MSKKNLAVQAYRPTRYFYLFLKFTVLQIREIMETLMIHNTVGFDSTNILDYN